MHPQPLGHGFGMEPEKSLLPTLASDLYRRTMYPGTGCFGSLRCLLRAFVKETDPAILERLTSGGNVGRNALAGWAIGACIWLSCRAVAVGFVLVSLER